MATNMSNEETFKFIELYQSENCLWNPKNKYHKNKNINDSWKRIADTMGVRREIHTNGEEFGAAQARRRFKTFAYKMY
ncbi:unnamed protein product [Arctia plantaginis]|uniref:MADF domain-containing protein n=1 Tax=Arctia plantaginis TaxID=874455 RepID=A0A8S1ANF2_ARCPL|nr:unnamed protein product [Arctia plantaginis]